MSSPEDSSDSGQENVLQPTKKRRIRRLQRACDVCRHKKSDWAVARGNKCTYCRNHDLDCSYTHGTREEKQGISEAYVESLESCIKKMTAYFNHFHPEVDLSKEFGTPGDLDSWMRNRKLPDDSVSAFLPDGPCTSTINLAPPLKEEPNSSDEDDFKLIDVQRRLQDMQIVDRFLGQASVLGKSSNVMLIKSALDMKLDNPKSSRSLAHMRSRRGEFWGPKPWEVDNKQTFDPRLHDFPAPDLLYALVDLWFTGKHLLWPLLHQPTFMKHLADGLHYREGAFAGVLLMVCACAARHSTDPRVIYPGTSSWPSAGWQWFVQARTYHQASLSSPSLHDVQMNCLACIYLEGTSIPQACWTLCGTAIRLAQDVGAHRKKAYQAKPTVEDELWKRAFWSLVLMDRWLSSQLGRTCAIQDEEFDLEYPIDCDDEYWTPEDPAKAFKQPPGKPSKVSYFISILRLNRILGMAMRTIFATTNKTNLLLELIGPQWVQRVVSAIDSALNEWADSVPEHLKWNPGCEETIWMLQSSCLYTSYYELQISIHRCFLPTAQKPSPVTFPSLSICANAARSCCHIIEVAKPKLPKIWREDIFGVCIAILPMASFAAALVLLLSIFGAKKNGMAIDTSKDMARVYICMQSIKESEDRWSLAGRLWDILFNISNVGELSFPTEPSPPGSSEYAASSSTYVGPSSSHLPSAA
ncbi:fungal-specific transcription factor domain-containing protein, partial [Vararia minispora EC-137]